MCNQPATPLVASDDLPAIVDGLVSHTGAAAFVAMVREEGSVQAHHSGGGDIVRASAAAALIRMRQLALPGAPECPGCAARLAEAEAALRAMRVDERAWIVDGSRSKHVH